jgi:hypothetical protein
LLLELRSKFLPVYFSEVQYRAWHPDRHFKAKLGENWEMVSVDASCFRLCVAGSQQNIRVFREEHLIKPAPAFGDAVLMCWDPSW